MDPIGASCYSLQIDPSTGYSYDQKQEEKLIEIIASTKSLSFYDNKTFKSLLPQIFATLLASSFHVAVGVSLAYSAVLVPQLESPESDVKVTITESSWIASCVALVVPLGSIGSGFLMDKIGRLNTIKLAAIPSTIGWALIALATNAPMLLVGRLLTGFGGAVGTGPAIVYITEIARPDMRGALLCTCPLYASFGMVITYLQGWFSSWRIVAWSSIVYTIVPVLCLWFTYESPTWLVSKGKNERAKRSLEWLHKYQNKNPEQNFAHIQLSILQKEHEVKLEKEQMEKRRGGAAQMLKRFSRPTGYKPLIILFGLFLIQQFAGIYVTLFYAVTFFEASGSNINPYMASVLIGTVRFLMSMVNTVLLKRFRKRILMMVSCCGMAMCMLVSGLFTQWIHEGTTDLTWVPIVALLMYVVTSMIGLLAIPWTMTAELFPLDIRGVAHSIAVGIANVLMFAAVQSYRSLDAVLGGAHAVQYFYGIVSLSGLIYVYIFVPETYGKKLTEIEEYFNNNTIYLTQKLRAKKEKKKLAQNRNPIVKKSKTKEDGKNNENNEQTEKMISA